MNFKSSIKFDDFGSGIPQQVKIHFKKTKNKKKERKTDRQKKVQAGNE